MARTPGNPIALGMPMPAFRLPDTLSGKLVSEEKIQVLAGYLVAFICNHCPFVKHIIPRFVSLAEIYSKKNISFIAINSNDIVQYPDDSPANMKLFAAQHRFCFPYLFDETQQVARNFYAACTPDIYLFDSDKKLYYHGQFDDSRPGNEYPVTGIDLEQALNSLLNGLPAPEIQKPSLGCNIKWKA